MTLKRVLQYSRIGTKLMMSRTKKETWPISVSFHVTKKCNLKCKHCYAVLDTIKEPELTIEQILSVIDELYNHGTLSIRLLGGEPLVRKELPEIIKKVKSKGMFCELVTNGTLLRKRIGQWPELKKLDSVCVSLDGDKILHDSIRGKGTFNRTIDGMYALIETGIPVRLHGALAADSFADNHEPHKSLAQLSAKLKKLEYSHCARL